MMVIIVYECLFWQLSLPHRTIDLVKVSKSNGPRTTFFFVPISAVVAEKLTRMYSIG